MKQGILYQSLVGWWGIRFGPNNQFVYYFSPTDRIEVLLDGQWVAAKSGPGEGLERQYHRPAVNGALVEAGTPMRILE
jgi:hypothetical protein